jgi:cytochrome c-type biogenesis protein CcmH
MKQRRPLIFLLMILLLVASLWSYLLLVKPGQRTLDQRVNDVTEQLKCPVCQDESVADSSAAIALQMRQVARQRLQSGQSEQQVLQYFASRYGNQILLTPPPQGFNLLAWLVPVAILLAGIALLSFVARDWLWQSRSRQVGENGLADADSLTDSEFEQYRAQLEQELNREDPLFG